MKSIKKNYIYNLAYQILALMAPLITTPYVSRVLGAEAIGEYSYAYSIVYYFMLAAILGTATYAEREISFCQDDRTKRSARFWDLFLLRNITSVVSTLVYGLMVILCFNNKLMAAIVTLNIVSVGLDTVWLFQGMEEFGRITLRDTCIKLLTVVSIFIFIKRTEDIYLYALIMSLSPVVSAASLLPFLHRYIDKICIKEVHPFYDFKSIIGLFIPTIAISVYAMLDKTMLGIFTTTKIENGYYEQATKLSKTALTVVTSLGTVMIPRISYYFEKKQTKLINEYMLKSYQFALLLGLPICFGLIGISDNLVPWFYGEGYDKVSVLLKVSGFLVIAIGLSNITGLQYLVPTKQQNKLTKSVCTGALVNIVLNAILIPKWYSVGAAIASVIAEFSVTFVQFVYVKDQLNLKQVAKLVPRYFAASMMMLLLLKAEDIVFQPGIFNTMLMVVSGTVTYFAVLFILRDKFAFEAFAILKKKIRRG